MTKTLFILIAVGLIWSSIASNLNSVNANQHYALSFDTSLSAEFAEERSSDTQDGEREFYKLDYLALNNISQKLLTLDVRRKAVESATLLSFISPVFTPPPDHIS